MEGLAAAASVVGIVSLAVQIAQIMQKQIDDVRNADERLLQIVHEVRATAAGLSNLQDLLLDEEKYPGGRVLNNQCREDIKSVLDRCNWIFRNIVVLLSKAGKPVLAHVDDFQQRMNKQGSMNPGQEITLNIELSSIEHLAWPWRLPRIEQHIADLNRLALAILLLINTAALGKRNTMKAKDSDSSTWHEGDEDDMLVSQLYYLDQALKEAGEHSVGGIPTSSEIQQLGVILEYYIIEVPKSWDANSTCTGIPISSTAVYKQALQNLNKKKLSTSVFDIFKRLPVYQQKTIKKHLNEMLGPRGESSNTYHEKPTLLGLEMYRHRRRRFLERIKSLTPLHGHGPPRGDLVILIAWTPRLPNNDRERIDSYASPGTPFHHPQGRQTMTTPHVFNNHHPGTYPARYQVNGRGGSGPYYDSEDIVIPERRRPSYDREDVVIREQRQRPSTRELIRFERQPSPPLLPRRRSTYNTEYPDDSQQVHFSKFDHDYVSTDNDDPPIWLNARRTSDRRKTERSRSRLSRPDTMIDDRNDIADGRSGAPPRFFGPRTESYRPRSTGTFYNPVLSTRSRQSSRRNTDVYDNMDDLADFLPPTEDEKFSVASYYLERWTTVFDALGGRLREKMRRRKDNFRRDKPERTDIWLPRPREARPPSSPPIIVHEEEARSLISQARSYERLRRSAGVPIMEPAGEQRSLQASSDMETWESWPSGRPPSSQNLRGADSTETPPEGGNSTNETSGNGNPEVNEAVSANTQVALLR